MFDYVTINGMTSKVKQTRTVQKPTTVSFRAKDGSVLRFMAVQTVAEKLPPAPRKK